MYFKKIQLSCAYLPPLKKHAGLKLFLSFCLIMIPTIGVQKTKCLQKDKEKNLIPTGTYK